MCALMDSFDYCLQQPTVSAGRCFTVARANLAMVLVRRIIADLVGDYLHLLELQESVDTARDNHMNHQLQSDQRQLVYVAERIRGYLEELDDIGVDLTDWSLGAVDFPCLVGGRQICLSWRMGCEQVESWHEMDEDPAVQRHLDTLGLTDQLPEAVISG